MGACGKCGKTFAKFNCLNKRIKLTNIWKYQKCDDDVRGGY